jgi:hypothetical protein
MGVHCMALYTNLVMHTMLCSQMINIIKGLLSILCNYFSKGLQWNLVLSKHTKVMKQNGLKSKKMWDSLDFYVVWIVRHVMSKHKTLFIEDGNWWAKSWKGKGKFWPPLWFPNSIRACSHTPFVVVGSHFYHV